MQYIESPNVWSMPQDQIQKLQPGQWVYAGEKDNKGRFWGVKKSGTVVVAWLMNARNSGNYAEYQQSLRTFAKS